MKIRILVGALSLAFAIPSFAAGVDGKWTADVPGRGGQPQATTFTFKAEGEKLTGTVSGMRGDNPISDGTVKGDDVAFNVVVSFNGNEFKLKYKGKLSGDEIKFTRTRDGGDQPGQEFTAKRSK